MDNTAYVKRLGELYESVMKLRSDKDYVVNQPQMDKLVEVMNFFLEIADKSNGEVEPVVLTPREEHGGVTASFIVLDIHGKDVEKFVSAIQHVSAMTIDATLDNKICISVTVPEVFKRKNED